MLHELIAKLTKEEYAAIASVAVIIAAVATASGARIASIVAGYFSMRQAQLVQRCETERRNSELAVKLAIDRWNAQYEEDKASYAYRMSQIQGRPHHPPRREELAEVVQEMWVHVQALSSSTPKPPATDSLFKRLQFWKK